MTLILSYLTRDYVVQVSDRRVTWWNEKNVIVKADDKKNKAINYCHRIAFGYTGLAEIEGTRTDLWFTKAIKNTQENTLIEVLESVRKKLTESFREIHISPEYKKHAFIGVGWAKPNMKSPYLPLFINITNYHAKQGNELSTPNEEFFMHSSYIDNNKTNGAFYPSTKLPKENNTQLQRVLRVFARKNIGPKIVIGFLAVTIRKIAEKNQGVGKDLMALCIPRKSLDNASPFYVGGVLSSESDTFLYLPAESNSEISYMPNYVCGGTAITNGKILKGIAAQEASINLPRKTQPMTLVLTDWIGSGDKKDTRRPKVSDGYKLIGYSDYTFANSWAKGEECPYYGLLVGIQAEEEILQELSKDNDYLVVMYEKDSLDSSPASSWFKDLESWLLQRDMQEDIAKEFIQSIMGLTLKEIIEELQNLLKSPKT